MVEFRGFIPTSLLDWDGKIVSVLYLPGCNFRCPFCHNSELVLHPENIEPVSWDFVEGHLESNRDFLDGVCITGGEPTLHRGLPAAIRKIKAMDLGVKLDTNGTNPSMLSILLKEKIVDSVSMDVKAPLDDKYHDAAGTRVDLKKVKRSINMLLKSDIDYEFRTTVLPYFHEAKDIEIIAQSIEGAKKYALQQFVPRNTLDPQFENLDAYLPEQLIQLSSAAEPYIEKVVVRGI